MYGFRWGGGRVGYISTSPKREGTPYLPARSLSCYKDIPSQGGAPTRVIDQRQRQPPVEALTRSLLFLPAPHGISLKGVVYTPQGFSLLSQADFVLKGCGMYVL